MSGKELVEKIRRGEVDCNNLQNFFTTMIRALMLDLNKLMKIRSIPVPHMIINTGDDTMWLLEKEYDYSKEPCEITNEQYIYNVIPRCTLSLGGVDTAPDQLSNPYVRGNFQYEIDNQLYTLNGECRRMPIKMQITLNYLLGSFNDALEMVQHVFTKLVFLRTFKFVYMGQTMIASYKLPESLQDEHQTELTGDTTDSKHHKIEVQLELESNIPVYAPKTVVEAVYITHPIVKTTVNRNEVIERDTATRAGYRSTGKRFGSR